MNQLFRLSILTTLCLLLVGCGGEERKLSLTGRWISRSEDPREYVDLELRDDGTFAAYGAESHLEGEFVRKGELLELKPHRYLGLSRTELQERMKDSADTLLATREATVDAKNGILIFKLGPAAAGSTVNLFKTEIMETSEDPNLNSAEQALVGEYGVAFGEADPNPIDDMQNRVGAVSSRITLLPDKTFLRPGYNKIAGTWKIGNAEVLLTEKQKSSMPLRFRVEQDGLFFGEPGLLGVRHYLVKRKPGERHTK